MAVWSVYDEDLGIAYLKVNHTYTGPLLATQDIRFELVFTSASDPFVDKKNIETDVGTCQMTQMASNKLLWNQVAADWYYKCSTSETCGATTLTVSNPALSTLTADTAKSDWIVNAVDLDNIYAPRCVAPTAA